MMNNVKHINGDCLPIHVRDKIDWENVSECIVTTIDKNGTCRIYTASIDNWTKIAWMLFVLNSYMNGKYKDIMDVTNDSTE